MSIEKDQNEGRSGSRPRPRQWLGIRQRLCLLHALLADELTPLSTLTKFKDQWITIFDGLLNKKKRLDGRHAIVS